MVYLLIDIFHMNLETWTNFETPNNSVSDDTFVHNKCNWENKFLYIRFHRGIVGLNQHHKVIITKYLCIIYSRKSRRNIILLSKQICVAMTGTICKITEQHGERFRNVPEHRSHIYWKSQQWIQTSRMEFCRRKLRRARSASVSGLHQRWLISGD